MTERSRRPSRGRSRGSASRGGSRDASRPSKKSAPSGPPPEELRPVLEPPDIKSFTEWELGDEIQGALAEMGIETPTPVQRLAIGSVLEGRDVIAKAETGTGKTLAFGAPMMAKVEAGRSTVLGLVLAPTRELAQQVAQVLEKLGEACGIGVALVVGGDPMQPQIKKLQSGVQVVVGTPGRVLDLMNQRFLKFPWLEFAVLDEADEMLEIGFLPDVEKILEGTAEERQTLLFSATFPPALLALARKHTRNPVELATAKGVSTVDRITQRVVFLGDEDRPHVLKRLLMDSSPDELFLVFCDRRTEVDRLMRRLERLPVGIKALHGGYDQAARFRVMSAFREGQVRALIATDVASRGLDVTGVTHVINYSPPRDISDYTHRIGRTGRAGRTGCAVTFVAGLDGRRWKDLERQMNWEVPTVAEHDLAGEILPNSKTRSRGSSRSSGSDRGRRSERDEPRRGREEQREPRQDRQERSTERAQRERPPRERSRTRERDPEESRPRRRSSAPREDREPERAEREPRRERTRRPASRAEAPRSEARSEPGDSEGQPRRKVRIRSSHREQASPPAAPSREGRPASRSRSERDDAWRNAGSKDREEAPRKRTRRRSAEPAHRSESAGEDSGRESASRDGGERPRQRRRRSNSEQRPAPDREERPERSRSERSPREEPQTTGEQARPRRRRRTSPEQAPSDRSQVRSKPRSTTQEQAAPTRRRRSSRERSDPSGSDSNSSEFRPRRRRSQVSDSRPPQTSGSDDADGFGMGV